MPTRALVQASAAAFGLGLLTALVMPACGSSNDDEGRKRALGATSANGTAASGFQTVDAGDGFCGNEIHEPTNQPPLLYFVVDSSGSMEEPVPGGTKYKVLKNAMLDVASSLGALIRVGASIYPTDLECSPGEEVLAPRRGDGAGETATQIALADALDRNPIGGTPTAAALRLVRERLHAPGENEGPQVVILVTDGAPNCSDGGECDASECGLNIDGQCPTSDSCCVGDESIFCLDRAATLDAIASFAEIDTKVYVVGLALGPAYVNLMSQMALAGGAAREDAPYFYPADDADALGARLREIAAALVTCTYTMEAAPEDAGLVNVYFDQTLVPFDPSNGWQWRDERTIELVGEACDRLKNGGARQVNIVTGCPTMTPS